MDCNDVVKQYNNDSEGVPERVIVQKRMTPDEYICNLINALAEAKEEGLCHGRLLTSPSEVLKSLMPKVMNAAGFCSTKWVPVSYCHTKE